MSITLQELLERHCGGVRGGWSNLQAVIPGGSSVPVLDANDCQNVRLMEEGEGDYCSSGSDDDGSDDDGSDCGGSDDDGSDDDGSDDDDDDGSDCGSDGDGVAVSATHNSPRVSHRSK